MVQHANTNQNQNFDPETFNNNIQESNPRSPQYQRPMSNSTRNTNPNRPISSYSKASHTTNPYQTNRTGYDERTNASLVLNAQSTSAQAQYYDTVPMNQPYLQQPQPQQPSTPIYYQGPNGLFSPQPIQPPPPATSNYYQTQGRDYLSSSPARPTSRPSMNHPYSEINPTTTTTIMRTPTPNATANPTTLNYGNSPTHLVNTSQHYTTALPYPVMVSSPLAVSRSRHPTSTTLKSTNTTTTTTTKLAHPQIYYPQTPQPPPQQQQQQHYQPSVNYSRINSPDGHYSMPTVMEQNEDPSSPHPHLNQNPSHPSTPSQYLMSINNMVIPFQEPERNVRESPVLRSNYNQQK